ncbi:cysteine hydrolase family protein [Flavobacterium sp. '19STA2R22 D10 B1']|uniref:cysteine hydrolase family protein n=1 Tax=Flavobacterium aerium TaxID=3037261 RepID=UPI00278BCE8E|nr:cysteine hydrolase family protein [Flavobacterium sp. '19STA2R22 D10 B1']
MKKALLLVDIQNDYFEGGAMTLVGAHEASEKAKKVLAKFRSEKHPVIHIQHKAISPTATFFIPNTSGVEIHSNVIPLPEEKVIVKNYPNSFRATELLAYLHLIDVTDLVICGMMTHMCIDATTRAAKDFNFNCTVIGDACATRDLEVMGQTTKANEVHYAFLAALNYFYATVTVTSDYLTES